MLDNTFNKKESPLVGMMGGGPGGPLGISGGSTADPTYVDDVFSTFAYDGTSSTQSINNGIDLSGEGGLVWIKNRDNTSDHALHDTERGATKVLNSNTDYAEATSSNFSSFNSNGFTITGSSNVANNSSYDYVSWTFRKAPGFFDVVTYTGTGSAQNISHSLGSVPGMIIIKRTSSSENWATYHRTQGATKTCRLNGDFPFSTSSSTFNNTEPTSTVFTVGTNSEVNSNGDTFVAYLFAHDDQSFGTDSDEAIIKCGTFTTDSSTALFDVNLGFEPQWLLAKRTDGSGDWFIIDQQREWSNLALERAFPNTTQAPFSNEYEGYFLPHSRGFKSTSAYFSANTTYIYMAIRRPHKPPEAGTEVFDVGLRSGSSSDAKTNSDIFTDMTFILRRNSSSEYNGIASRIIGRYSLKTSNSDNDNSGWLDTNAPWGYSTGAMVNGGNGASNTGNLIDFSFKRAPGFFDVVAYTGTSSVTTVDHNLEAVPELILLKGREDIYNWSVYTQTLGRDKVLYLNEDEAASDFTAPAFWGSTDFTDTQFSLGTYWNTNRSGYRYVAYLFASLSGISKVGTYSGTGNNIDVDCGFTAGARFVLIKRTDGSSGASGIGNWYVWNTASGIASGNDPYMVLDETNAEVTNTDYIDPLNAGFTVTSSAPAAINANGGTYLFLAIA